MRVDNIRWHPIRLHMERARANAWRILRNGISLGEVSRDAEGWTSAYAREGITPGGSIVLRFCDQRRHPSFATAVLRVSRPEGILAIRASSDGPQDFGQVRMLRINVATRWYTVVVDGHGDRYVYEDFTIGDEMSDQQQTILRRVLIEVDRHLGRESL